MMLARLGWRARQPVATRMLATIAPTRPSQGGQEQAEGSATVAADQRANAKTLARQRKQMTLLRKKYYHETVISRRPRTPPPAAAEPAQQQQSPDKKKDEPQVNMYTNDALVVGAVGSKRARKSLRLLNAGRFPTVDEALAYESRDKRRRPKKNVLTANEAMQALYVRDLSPKNPRLAHLTHLFNSSRHFITPRTIDVHLTQFWSRDPDTSHRRSLFERITLINEYGVGAEDNTTTGPGARGKGAHPAYFDVQQLGEDDVHFAPNAGSTRKVLLGGDLLQHQRLREQMVTDRLFGRLMGAHGVQAILQWAKANSVEADPVSASTSSSTSSSTSK